MFENVPVSGSTPLTRALQLGNSQATDWNALIPTITPPSGDGVFAAGHEGQFAPGLIKLMPISQGSAAGTQFLFRVYAWDSLRAIANTSEPRATWIPSLLGEFLCTDSGLCGPTYAGYTGLLEPNESLCDTITLNQGSLGPTELIKSTGPGTDLAAYVKLDLAGCRFFQFDFKQVDQIGMNCLWSRC